jgi:hypothetical protein
MHEEMSRASIHRVIESFSQAMAALGHQVPPLSIERWGIAVHHCLSSRARDFHTHQHVLDIVRDADPLEILAALYHDTVYVQVDLGVAEPFTAHLQPLLRKENAACRILPDAAQDPVAADVLAVFGRSPDDLLTPFTGLNELASALVAAKELEGVLTRTEQLAVAACIEASIPFRNEIGATLERRLSALGIGAQDAYHMVRRAVRLSNKDVGNFADPDPGRFLDNTWKLLPETNPSLRIVSTYTVRDYRLALQKMEGFLSQLPAERVFHVWDGEPAAEVHAQRVQAARINIDLAVRYLRCKLYGIAMVEAFAMESGGDAPLELFMGGIPKPGGPRMRRIEQFLPQLPQVSGVDPALLTLLQDGRATASFFDLTTSPLASFLISTLGEASVMAGFVQARDWWAEKSTAREFLSLQPRATTTALAEAATHIADTRAAALRELMRQITQPAMLEPPDRP